MNRKMKTNRFKKYSNKAIILIYGALVLMLFVWIYILPNVSEAFKKTDIIDYGGIQVKDEIICYFVRSESVYYANNAGQIQYFAIEGDQLRKGSKVLNISSEASQYLADQRGMLSYYIDGLESYFKPETMRDLKKEAVNNLKIEVKNTNRDTAAIGEPIYKIVNSDSWYAITWIKKESIIKYQKGKDITLKLKKGSVIGSIEDIIKSGGDFMVVLKFNHYNSEMAQIRKINTEIITADYKGLIISNKSIKTVGDKTGVYVKDISGNFVFKPISIITSDGVYSLVESAFYYETSGGVSQRVETVDIYDEVLKNGEPN